MTKNPVYGFEKPYLENIQKENAVYVNNSYFDDFGNLIMIKNGGQASKTVVIGFTISENSFLINNINDDGTADAVSLFKTDDTITNEKIVLGSRIGYITKENEKFVIDFGADDKKTAERIVKTADAVYIKPYFDASGNSFFTNEKAFALKSIATMLIKNEYPFNAVFCFIRETNKGAYALGKNLKSDYAFFPTICENSKEDISYVKKEGNYISNFETKKIFPYVSENVISSANSYYLAGGCEIATGISLKCKKFDNGCFKISKKSIDALKDFIENFQGE